MELELMQLFMNILKLYKREDMLGKKVSLFFLRNLAKVWLSLIKKLGLSFINLIYGLRWKEI